MARAAALDHAAWRRNAWRNRLQSALLLVAMGAYLSLLGWLLWGPAGLGALLAVGIAAVTLNPSVAPQIVMRMYRAQPLSERQLPDVVAALVQLARRAGLPKVPQLYYVPSRLLNAFAVGNPGAAAIAVTDGLLRNLSGRELLGVLAHEISHVRGNDIWVMGLADLFSRATSTLSLLGQLLLLLNLPILLMDEAPISWWAIALLIFAPTLSALTQLALSRTREFDADLNAARLTGDPDGLASALLKMERLQGGWLERILMPGRRVPEPSLLRTHPHTDERIARLAALKREQPLRIAPPGFSLQAADFAADRIHRRPGWHWNGLWY